MPATKNDVAFYSAIVLANVVTSPIAVAIFIGLALYHLIMMFYED